MAMTLRIPEEIDAQLEKLAESRRSSKHALVVQAIDELVRRELKTQQVIQSLDETSRDYADLIARLEDA